MSRGEPFSKGRQIAARTLLSDQVIAYFANGERNDHATDFLKKV